MLLLALFRARDDFETLLRIFLAVVENVPARALGKPLNEQKQADGVDLHGNDRNPPCPFVELAERNCDGQVDGERHVQAEDVGLELLRQRFASCVVGRQFRTVCRDHAIHASHAQPHDHSAQIHDRESVLPVSQPRDEHDQVPNARHKQAPEQSRSSPVFVCQPAEDHCSYCTAQVVD